MKQDPGAKTVKRCESVASDDKDITGSECEDVPFIETEPAGPKGSMYVRTAFTFTSTDKSLGGYPGAELRVALENLIQKPRAELRAVGFFTPVLGPTAARFGVGFDVSIPMSTATADSSGGDAVFTPFVVVGAAPAKW